MYMEIRAHLTPSSETRCRVDACEAVTRDIVKIAFERISGIDGEFDSEEVKQHLHELLQRDYAHSIYGSTASRSSKNSSKGSSQHSVIAVKRADAAAELAAKEAEYEVLLKEERQKVKIQLLEEQQRRELEAQKLELERLKAEKDIRAARARFTTYDQEIMQEASVHSADQRSTKEQQHVYLQQPVSSASIQQPAYVTVTTSPARTDVSYLAQTVQDSIALNRLPMPEPSVFTGDPIQFIEWKAAFTSLIDKKTFPQLTNCII